MNEKSVMGTSFLFLIFWYHALKTREKVHEQVTVAFSSMESLQYLLLRKQSSDEYEDDENSMFDLEDEETMFHFQQTISSVDILFLRNVMYAFVMVPLWTIITGVVVMVILLLFARWFNAFAEVRAYSQAKLMNDNGRDSNAVNLLQFFERATSLSENNVYYYVNYLLFHPEIAVFLAILPVFITIVYVFLILSPLDKIDSRLIHVHVDIVFACYMIATLALLFVPLMMRLDEHEQNTEKE